MMGGRTSAGADYSIAIGRGTNATPTKPLALGTNGNQMTITNTGDVVVETVASGIILKSPDGSCYRISVANGGALSTVSVTCP